MGEDGAHYGAQVEEGDQHHHQQLPGRLLVLDLAAVAVQAGPDRGHQDGGGDHQHGQGDPHQGHQGLEYISPELRARLSIFYQGQQSETWSEY